MKPWQALATLAVAGSLFYFGVQDSKMIARCESRGESTQSCKLQILGR